MKKNAINKNLCISQRLTKKIEIEIIINRNQILDSDPRKNEPQKIGFRQNKKRGIFFNFSHFFFDMSVIVCNVEGVYF